jgi:hypothetical protein
MWTTWDAAVARYPNPTDADRRAIRKEAFADFILWLEQPPQLPPNQDPLKAAFDWLADGNERRNAALYVDLVDGRWESPGTTSREDFKRDLATAKYMVSSVTGRATTLLGADAATQKTYHEMYGQFVTRLSASRD